MSTATNEPIEKLRKLVEKSGITPSQLERLAAEVRRVSSNKTNKKSARSKLPVIAQTKGIQKIFNHGKNNEVVALSDIDIEVRKGEIVALVGASGSGKSTLLNIIAGLEKPTDGSVLVDSKEITELSDIALSNFRATTIGFVFQFFYLQPFLSLQRNIEVPLMFAGVKSRAERESRSRELIELVGLSDRIEHRPGQLSGGQMQRAAIARALINRPKLVIADEPTGNLDTKNAEVVMDLFETIRNTYDSSVLVVTHDTKIADRADRILHMEDGKIV